MLRITPISIISLLIIGVLCNSCGSECENQLDEYKRVQIDDTAADGGVPDKEEMEEKYCEIYCADAEDCQLQYVTISSTESESYICCYKTFCVEDM